MDVGHRGNGAGLLSLRVLREGARGGQPRNCMARQGGGLARRLRHWGHDSKRQQALVPSLKRKPAALLDARSRQLRFALRCHEAFRDGLGDRNTSCDFEKLTFRVR